MWRTVGFLFFSFAHSTAKLQRAAEQRLSFVCFLAFYLYIKILKDLIFLSSDTSRRYRRKLLFATQADSCCADLLVKMNGLPLTAGLDTRAASSDLSSWGWRWCEEWLARHLSKTQQELWPSLWSATAQIRNRLSLWKEVSSNYLKCGATSYLYLLFQFLVQHWWKTLFTLSCSHYRDSIIGIPSPPVLFPQWSAGKCDIMTTLFKNIQLKMRSCVCSVNLLVF